MHLHSNYSFDGKASPRDILKQARKIGLGGVCITDHNTLKGNTEARKVAKEFGLLVISGMEISSSGGHILAMGISEEVPRDQSPEETLEKIHGQGGVCVIPHPFRRWSGLGAETVRAIKPDAIEVLNSHSTPGDNRKARELAKAMKLPVTAGSDAHDLGMIGRASISIPDVGSEEEAIECILSGKAEASGRNRSLPGTLKDRTETVVNWVGRGFRKM